jgi:predicted metal-binding membrane protein
MFHQNTMKVAADCGEAKRPGRAPSSETAFLGGAALLFAVSAALTVEWCGSMSAMGGMRMPGGWTMSMAWMRMHGQTWSAAAASFLGMWSVMMLAMMLPSLVPMLSRYRRAIGGRRIARRGRLTVVVGAGYFAVWTAFGSVVFPIGVALAAVEMRRPASARAVPLLIGAVVLSAGVLQCTRWKARRLACCGGARGGGGQLASDVGTAWRHGLRLGLDCLLCCSPLTAILLAIGVMDLAAMTVVTAAISLERLVPSGARVARATGAVAIGAGVYLVATALLARAVT